MNGPRGMTLWTVRIIAGPGSVPTAIHRKTTRPPQFPKERPLLRTLSHESERAAALRIEPLPQEATASHIVHTDFAFARFPCARPPPRFAFIAFVLPRFLQPLPPPAPSWRKAPAMNATLSYAHGTSLVPLLGET